MKINSHTQIRRLWKGRVIFMKLRGGQENKRKGREVEQHEDRGAEKHKGRRRMTQKPVCDKIALCGKCKKWYKTA